MGKFIQPVKEEEREGYLQICDHIKDGYGASIFRLSLDIFGLEAAKQVSNVGALITVGYIIHTDELRRSGTLIDRFYTLKDGEIETNEQDLDRICDHMLSTYIDDIAEVSARTCGLDALQYGPELIGLVVLGYNLKVQEQARLRLEASK